MEKVLWLIISRFCLKHPFEINYYFYDAEPIIDLIVTCCNCFVR